MNWKCAYTVEKDVQIITIQNPLLFVHGPPVFIQVSILEEESTSVFVSNEIEREESLETKSKENQAVALQNPSILRRIMYLSGSFQRNIYRPLQFVVGEETFTGKIGKVEDGVVLLELEGENQVVTVEITKIDEILWRGQPFVDD